METNAIYCKDKMEIMRRDIVKNSIDATSIDEARQLIEAGFEYIMDVNSIKLFRKRK
jgi:dihydropteroate synthase